MFNGVVKFSNHINEVGLHDLPYRIDKFEEFSSEFFFKKYSELCPIEKAHVKAAVVNKLYNELQKADETTCPEEILSLFLEETHTLGSIENVR